MNDLEKNVESNSFWILCPSKRFPGKFYHFNTLNGEAVWSHQNDNKHIKKDLPSSSGISHRIMDKSHGYPEPITLPDAPITLSHNILSNFQNSVQLPTFGQAIFPKYVSNDQPLIPNIVWTPSPFPMFCPERMPMFDKGTQIPESEQEVFAQSSNIPLCKQYVKSTEAPKDNQKGPVLETLDKTDLRFILLAKRKTLAPVDVGVESKKPKANLSTRKKKVRFNTESKTNDINNETAQEDLIILKSIQTQTVHTPKSPELLKDPSSIKDTSKIRPLPRVQPPTLLPTTNNQQPSETNQQPTYKNTNWYIVVDTDVLLLDYELIDQVVLSDPKCRLVIPYAVAADIEELCRGDCRGQQRVINARQLTRRFMQPPQHYIVEHQSPDNGNIVVTTQSILQCCMKAANKNYYVVLITNDPHLQMTATLQNIHSYKLNEIKYGVKITPPYTSELKNIKNNSTNYNMDTKNQFKQNSNLFSKTKNQPKRDDIKHATKNDDENAKNFRNPVVKQLFLSSDSETDCTDDKFINNTNPKCMKNLENLSKSDSDGISDISSEVSSLNLKDKPVLKPQNSARNPFPTQKFEKRTQNPVLKPNHETQFQNDTLVYNFEKPEKIFCSLPITNMKLFKPKSTPKKSEKPLSLPQDPFGPTRDNLTLSASQTRIKKIISTINTETAKTQEDSSIPKTKDEEIFKIPKRLPIKNVTRNASVHLEGTTINDKIGTRKNIDPIDENLSRFYIKSINMREKIDTRIDEWICSYMQIMEDALVNILQNDRVCMENTVAPLNFKDTLNCINMMYGCHTKIRDIIHKLTELLEKCMICTQGRLKLDMAPEDFMKVFGYGVLLILSLKNILPLNVDLKEAEFRLNVLQIHLETNIHEVDPELVKSPSVNQSEIDKDEQQMKPFLKKKSYVTNYLKKHFEEWATYEGDLEDQIEDHKGFKVVRTCGKNLNQLKLDRSKTMSLAKNTNEKNSTNETKNGSQCIRLLENNQINKMDKIEMIKETNVEKSTKLSNKENGQNNDIDIFSEEFELLTEKEKDVPLKKLIENIEQDDKIESTVKEDLNYTPHENTFVDKNDEKNGPKIVRNIKLIDEFEQKYKKREPLDLDLLDYSEIYEPSISKNVDFDVYSEKNKNSEEITKFEEPNNFELTTTMTFLEDFFITPSISPDSKINHDTQMSENTETSINSNCSENSDQFISVSEYNNKTSQIEVKAEVNCEEESETFTEKQDSSGNDMSETRIDKSETRIDKYETRIDKSETRIDNSETRIDESETSKDKSETGLDNSEIRMDDSETRIDNSETRMDDSGTHLDNSETSDCDKTTEIIQDGSANDSDFENDGTYAHSTIKIFLYELGTTFKEIHTFVMKFINEIHETEYRLSGKRKDVLHYRASKALEDMVAIMEHLKSIIKRESREDTVLKRLLRNAGVEANTDKRMTRYRQIVIKSFEQGLILESALKIIVSTTIGDYEAISTNAETLFSNIGYFNIFE